MPQPHGATELRRHGQALARVAAQIGPVFDRQHGLHCHTGEWLESVVFKLQKAAWANSALEAGPTDEGIFFSIWIHAPALRERRALYNVHALKLRKLAAYKLQSRKFADAFRQRFAPFRASWPNVSIDHGPQTLMQGWIEIDPAHFERDVKTLAERFAAQHGIIDALLAPHKKPSESRS